MIYSCVALLWASLNLTRLYSNFLADKGYRASLHKAQLSQVTVTYLGVQLSHDSKAITLDRKQLIWEILAPKTKEEILSFLGLARYFRVWIPNSSLLAAPIYDATKEDPSEPLLTSVNTPFWHLPQALLQTPALHLPDTQKLFTLYVHENKGLALGVLGQDKGPTFAPVAYLSKKT
jgi:hypothetical protein